MQQLERKHTNWLLAVSHKQKSVKYSRMYGHVSIGPVIKIWIELSNKVKEAV